MAGIQATFTKMGLSVKRLVTKRVPEECFLMMWSWNSSLVASLAVEYDK